MQKLLDVITLGLTYYIRSQIIKQENISLVNQTRLLTAHVDTKVKIETQKAMADAIKRQGEIL